MASPSPKISTTPTSRNEDENSLVTTSLAQAETRWVNCLRLAVIAVLLLATIGLSAGVYLYTRQEEQDKFEAHFEDSALQVIENFHDLVDRHIGAASSLSTDITSYALDKNLTFPFVTLPDFALKGSNFRIHSGSHVVHWLPLVTDERRGEWQDFAYENREQIDDAFEVDLYQRTLQDQQLGRQTQNNGSRHLQQQGDKEKGNLTVLEDGTGYHPRIWNNAAITIEGDAPDDSGPYLPAWQRSPISPIKQDLLNLNFANTGVVGPGVFKAMLTSKKAVFRNAFVPIPKQLKNLEANLRISQYRNSVSDLLDGLNTFLLYPVFESFQPDAEVTGVLATSIYWNVLFSHLVPSTTRGLICVIENSFNQTFSYRIDGPEATSLGIGDHHDPKFDYLSMSMSVNEYLEALSSPQNRAYNTVPLSRDTEYHIRVYPSQDTADEFLTNKPALYTAIVILGFSFASFLFLVFSYVVERRQRIMLEKVVENAKRVAAAERELNEFLSHEVRNPLASAMSACTFVMTAINEPQPLVDEETRKSAREDIEVVNSSLHFINDFLRSMLDIHKASGNQIKIEKTPTDVLHDVFEPVSAILYKRVANFDVIVDCPPSLIVMTDSIRLKQVVLNLVRNSSKFVERGFVRMRAAVVDHQVRIYVEDSGPGVPLDKREDLFQKYQPSLDLLHQGTGLGLSLVQKLMASMGGNVWLDEDYESGVEGCPGACFVVELHTNPVDIEATLPTDSDSDLHNGATNVQVALPNSDTGKDETAVHESPADEKVIMPEEDTQALPEEELPPDLSVLFVDDDVVLRKLFVRAVKKVQPAWNIQEVSSGERALELCESASPDLIFLDQYMASVDKQLLGTETSVAMRAKGVTSIICGLSANDIRDNFINSGADDFILKPMPCRPDELKQVLAGLLSRKGSLQGLIQ
ncbi:sensor kinase/phosphatase LuxQ [Seminavis robusta]|uniref:histidine kinase n=1 Tax=Seminavis robusta TaxID=568900 RepID=A0A9N8EY46_9STRA|nr:sensor kinase/phosphatase LuxQ [Seminavis robusta]|eukprot:Sro1904_g304550.1 sensor kinase/phosphatase LuxQ (920) ;mRNA; r:3607-6649